MHVHVSALNALITLAYFLLFMFIIRMFQAKYPDNNYAQALNFLT